MLFSILRCVKTIENEAQIGAKHYSCFLCSEINKTSFCISVFNCFLKEDKRACLPALEPKLDNQKTKMLF